MENIKSSLQFEESRFKRARNPEAMGHEKQKAKDRTPSFLAAASNTIYIQKLDVGSWPRLGPIYGQVKGHRSPYAEE